MKSTWKPGLQSVIHSLLLMVVLAACQAPQVSTPTPAAPSPVRSITSTVEATAPGIPPPTATGEVLPSAQPSAVLPPAAHTPLPLDSLQFDLPTQTPFSLSGWRPPLYPTPWAPTLYDHFFFASPIAANEINAPVADYRYGGVFFQDIVHTGVDIPAPKGTPVLAAGPGTVIWAGYGVYQGGVDPRDPYGLAVTIRHDFGYQNQRLFTVYGHLDQVNVVEGQHVETGEQLGLVGETGKVTGPHLHFEVRLGENSFFTTRNPELWLVPPIGWGVIAGRVMDTIDRPLSDQMVIFTDPKTEQNSFAWSYGKTTVNSDAYYQENLVVGDIPAGIYTLRIAFGGMNFSAPIEVKPGMVSYFTFHGYKGIVIEAPPEPGDNFTPAPLENPAP